MSKINQETGEFVEEKEIVSIELSPNIEMILPKINFNYEELKELMSVGLKEYAIEVTGENLKDAKQMATKLNKLASEIKKARIASKKEILVPVSEFETKMNDLEDTAQKGRQFILDQVKVFDDAQITICTGVSNSYLDTKYSENLIDEEFRDIDITDLFIVSGLTSSSNLSKKTKDTIDSRVAIQLSKQSNKKMRLMQLENECLKAELKVLLNESDVESFILESELVYSEKLSELIVREQNKQRQIEVNIENARIKELEKEQLKKEVEDNKIEAEQAEVKKEIEKNEKETGVKIVTVVATFEVEVGINVEDRDIVNKYEEKLNEIFTTLKSVTPF